MAPAVGGNLSTPSCGRRLQNWYQCNSFASTKLDQNQHIIPLLPIYHALGERRVRAIQGFHALSGCDTTGHILGKSKTSWWNIFVSASEEVLTALEKLGIGEEPTLTVLCGCEEFICKLLRPTRTNTVEAKELRWYWFCKLQPHEGIERLPPTVGAIFEHVCHAHLQSNV